MKLKYNNQELTLFFKNIILSVLFTGLLTLNTKTDAVELNIEQIDDYLVHSEQQFSDIIDKTQKKVRWYQDEVTKTEFALVYLHGFSASSQELSPTTEILSDKLKANAFYTRLSGHGRSDDAMAEATVDAWKNDVLEAYQIGQLIGHKVIIVSTSTGGTLATWLLNQENIAAPFANIMVSPNYAIQSKSAWLLRSWLGLKIAKLINGDYNSFDPHSPEHAKYWTQRYPLEAVRPMLSLLDEVKELDKSKASSPQLLIFSPQDRVINVDEIKNVAKQFTNSKTTLIEFMHSTDPYQHVLSGKACSSDSTEKMVDQLFSYINSLEN